MHNEGATWPPPLDSRRGSGAFANVEEELEENLYPGNETPSPRAKNVQVHRLKLEERKEQESATVEEEIVNDEHVTVPHRSRPRRLPAHVERTVPKTGRSLFDLVEDRRRKHRCQELGVSTCKTPRLTRHNRRNKRLRSVETRRDPQSSRAQSQGKCLGCW